MFLLNYTGAHGSDRKEYETCACRAHTVHIFTLEATHTIPRNNYE